MSKPIADKRANLYQNVFFLTMAGCVFYLLALPPVELWPLGWIVAAFWTPLIRRKSLLSPKNLRAEEKMSKNQISKTKKGPWVNFLTKNRFKNRPYRQIWLAGVIFWGVAVHWICFPHWATCFGWLALIAYLGLYFPLFFFLARVTHHTPVFGRNIPVWLAAPLSWLTISYLKGTLMGGFGFALLEHTQYKQVALIQIADLGGESLLGAVMIFVGVLLGYYLPIDLSWQNQSSGTEKYAKTSRKKVLSDFHREFRRLRSATGDPAGSGKRADA